MAGEFGKSPDTRFLETAAGKSEAELIRQQCVSSLGRES